MHSFGLGDAYAADDLRPHFYDLYKSCMELIKPIRSVESSNDEIINVLDDVVRMIDAHPETSPYFGVQRNKQSRQILYFGFKTIHNVKLYKSGTPEVTSSATCTLLRQDTKGHAYEQMVYALVFVLYWLSLPRTNKRILYSWRKILKDSDVPFFARNATEKGVADWMVEHENALDKTVRLHQEWQRDEFIIRLSPLEARMIAFTNGNDDISSEAINKTLASGQVESNVDGYQIYLARREGIDTVVKINQGQVGVEMKDNKFYLDSYCLQLYQTLPETALTSLRGRPIEEICEIGVFEGLGLKSGNLENLYGNCQIDIKYPKTGIEYVLSPKARSAITR